MHLVELVFTVSGVKAKHKNVVFVPEVAVIEGVLGQYPHIGVVGE
jgi:hypothetical protein